MLKFYMPANLPPEYFEAERRFREASTPAEKVIALEELIATIPKHKGTDRLRGDLRRKLSQLKKEAETFRRSRKGRRGSIYVVEKEGAAQVSLVGFPNSGKSSLLACLTNATPVIAEYPISTVTPVPGMMPFEDIQIQLVDLPPIGNESTDGWVSGILRIADALMLVLDCTEDLDTQAELLKEQLGRWRIYINKALSTQHSALSASVGVGKRALLVANKNDLPGSEDNFIKLRERWERLCPCISVSALKKENLEELKRAIFGISGIIRVYSKPPGKEPDLTTPFTIPSGSTVMDLARAIHKDFISNMKFARIWGSARFGGQRVEKNYVLRDRDVVEINI